MSKGKYVHKEYKRNPRTGKMQLVAKTVQKGRGEGATAVTGQIYHTDASKLKASRQTQRHQERLAAIGTKQANIANIAAQVGSSVRSAFSDFSPKSTNSEQTLISGGSTLITPNSRYEDLIGKMQYKGGSGSKSDEDEDDATVS